MNGFSWMCLCVCACAGLCTCACVSETKIKEEMAMDLRRGEGGHKAHGESWRWRSGGGKWCKYSINAWNSQKLNEKINNLFKEKRVWRNALVVKNTEYSPRGTLGFDSQHPQGSSQPSITPGSWAPGTHVVGQRTVCGSGFSPSTLWALGPNSDH